MGNENQVIDIQLKVIKTPGIKVNFFTEEQEKLFQKALKHSISFHNRLAKESVYKKRRFFKKRKNKLVFDISDKIIPPEEDFILEEAFLDDEIIVLNEEEIPTKKQNEILSPKTTTEKKAETYYKEITVETAMEEVEQEEIVEKVVEKKENEKEEDIFGTYLEKEEKQEETKEKKEKKIEEKILNIEKKEPEMIIIENNNPQPKIISLKDLKEEKKEEKSFSVKPEKNELETHNQAISILTSEEPIQNKNLPTKTIEEPTKIFLEDESDKNYYKKEIYSLAAEFAKTKKNKGLGFYPVIFFFVLVLAGATFFMIQDIQEKSLSLQVKITDFEDLNLAEVLNKAKQTEAQLGVLKEELESSKQKFELEKERLRKEAEEKIAGIMKQNISEAEKQKLIEAIRNQEKQAIWNIQVQYESKIREKENEMRAIQQKMLEYEKKFKEDIRKAQEEAIIGKNQVLEIEIEKVKKYYEQKLALANEQAQKQLKETQEYHKKLIEELRASYNEKIQGLEKQLQQASIEAASKIKALQDELAVKKEQEIKNIAELNKKTKEIEILQQEKSDLTKNLAEKQRLLSKYYEALDYLAKSHRESGYILDPGDPSNIIVIINTNYPVFEGDKGFVFDDEDRMVATIIFHPEKNYIRASLTPESKNAKLLPFYRILIQSR